jgi:hypothetical protein
MKYHLLRPEDLFKHVRLGRPILEGYSHFSALMSKKRLTKDRSPEKIYYKYLPMRTVVEQILGCEHSNQWDFE